MQRHAPITLIINLQSPGKKTRRTLGSRVVRKNWAMQSTLPYVVGHVSQFQLSQSYGRDRLLESAQFDSVTISYAADIGQWQSINQSINQSKNQSIDQSIDQSINRLVDWCGALCSDSWQQTLGQKSSHVTDHIWERALWLSICMFLIRDEWRAMRHNFLPRNTRPILSWRDKFFGLCFRWKNSGNASISK